MTNEPEEGDSPFMIELKRKQALVERVYADVEKATDDDLIAMLRERFTGDPVPPCRVCGAELTIGSIGGNTSTKYACPNADTLKHEWGSPEQREAMEHYRASEFFHNKPGDTLVLQLLDRYQHLLDEIL